MNKLQATLQSSASAFNAAMFWPALPFMSVRFSALANLRPHLRLSSLADEEFLSISSPACAGPYSHQTIKDSQFGRGCCVYLGRAGRSVCLVLAMTRYLALIYPSFAGLMVHY